MSDEVTRRQMTKQSSLRQPVISVCLPSRRVWLVPMNQLRLDQSLPELTANRKLTSCQNGEISEETTLHTYTQRKAEVHMDKHGSWNWTCSCHHAPLDIYLYTQKHKYKNTHCSIFLFSGDSWLPFLEECHCMHTYTKHTNKRHTYKTTHKAVRFKLELFLNADLFHFNPVDFIFTLGSQKHRTLQMCIDVSQIFIALMCYVSAGYHIDHYLLG